MSDDDALHEEACTASAKLNDPAGDLKDASSMRDPPREHCWQLLSALYGLEARGRYSSDARLVAYVVRLTSSLRGRKNSSNGAGAWMSCTNMELVMTACVP